ncbi:MAG: flagellar biosynthetic protein FliR, partial [Castellaniella sp.]
MISFQIDQLYDWINGLLWPLFRIAGLVALAPVFSESSVPMRVKIGLSVVIT